MHPVLLELGPLRVPSYGAMLALGFVAALCLIRRLAVASDLEPRRVIEAVCWLVLGGGVGSRLFFVLEAPADLVRSPLDAFVVPGVLSVAQALSLVLLATAGLALAWRLRSAAGLADRHPSKISIAGGGPGHPEPAGR